jgi:hypothetical protein
VEIIEYLTAILVFITGVYAYLTYRTVKSSEASVEIMRNQSEEMLRPYISVIPFVRHHTPFLYLRITNTGKTGAKNLCLSIDRDFFQFGENDNPQKNLRNMNAFNTPMDSFSPGAELIFGLAQAWVLFENGGKSDLCPVQFTVTAKYEFSGKKVEEKHFIDLRCYLKTEGERDPVVDELEKIRKVLEKFIKPKMES